MVPKQGVGVEPKRGVGVADFGQNVGEGGYTRYQNPTRAPKVPWWGGAGGGGTGWQGRQGVGVGLLLRGAGHAITKGRGII